MRGVLDTGARVWFNGGMETTNYTAAVLDTKAAKAAGFTVIDDSMVEVKTGSALESQVEAMLAIYGIYEIDGVIVIEAP